jgi:hypothetical protein
MNADKLIFCRILDFTFFVLLKLDRGPHFVHICLGQTVKQFAAPEEPHGILHVTQDTATGPHPGVSEFNTETCLK